MYAFAHVQNLATNYWIIYVRASQRTSSADFLSSGFVYKYI